MKKKAIETIRERLREDRPMTTITMRLPEDVLDELRHVAPLLGVSGYQPLIRAYISRGLREDASRLQDDPIQQALRGVAETLRASGVAEAIIARAIEHT
ncbi:hypothetical protein [Paraburkholderia sp. BL21I4N1]|uniref:hypothetical protein n=1 Tax=Paraburkholderia sp. BL21I4N1 TaxID=1938801 RepID=UPI000CFBC5E2|nr:hypothetical protein [Paraburkholderia sp. BL21I4N1]PQV48594.1 hypothetical protein B0G83_108121 [Paraburkholderia sp. BL21I4N1]